MTQSGDETYNTPGQLIEDLLGERGWSRRITAVILGVDETTLTKVIAGDRPLKPHLAIMLEELFDVPAERFLQLQKDYELATERIRVRPDPGRATRAHIFGNLPISAMIKRGWIDAPNARKSSVPIIEAELARFFRVDSSDEIETLPHAAKKTMISGDISATPVQLAWLYRAKRIAEDFMAPRYSEKVLAHTMGKLAALRLAPEDARHVPQLLTEAGVRYVIVESLPGAKIDGACFWLDSLTPVIAMSFRFDRIDNFWFVLRHEIEHVLQGHGREDTAVMLDAELEGTRAGIGVDVLDEERIANSAAAEFCVPQDMLQKFLVRKDPFFSERDLIGFARMMKVHPGLIAGQIRHKTGRHNLFRDYLVSVRNFVTPTAMTDGWGEVFPLED